MTDAILGHDCDGRELRAGDRVEVAYGGRFAGQAFTVLGPCPASRTAVEIDKPDSDPDSPYKWWSAFCWGLRLINSGRELFDQCAREADKMPTESTIRQRMPEKEEL